jgi:hypothetical protein
MKNEKEIQIEYDRLFKIFMNQKQKKPIRDDAFIRFHALAWVLEDEEDIVKKRLREINVGRTAIPETQ